MPTLAIDVSWVCERGPRLETDKILFIQSELDLQNAGEACTGFAAQIARKTPLLIEFDEPNANVFALQVAIACKLSLQSQDGFLGFGPIAERELGQLLKDTSTYPSETFQGREPQ